MLINISIGNNPILAVFNNEKGCAKLKLQILCISILNMFFGFWLHTYYGIQSNKSIIQFIPSSTGINPHVKLVGYPQSFLNVKPNITLIAPYDAMITGYASNTTDMLNHFLLNLLYNNNGITGINTNSNEMFTLRIPKYNLKFYYDDQLYDKNINWSINLFNSNKIIGDDKFDFLESIFINFSAKIKDIDCTTNPILTNLASDEYNKLNNIENKIDGTIYTICNNTHETLIVPFDISYNNIYNNWSVFSGIMYNVDYKYNNYYFLSNSESFFISNIILNSKNLNYLPYTAEDGLNIFLCMLSNISFQNKEIVNIFYNNFDGSDPTLKIPYKISNENANDMFTSALYLTLSQATENYLNITSNIGYMIFSTPINNITITTIIIIFIIILINIILSWNFNPINKIFNDFKWIIKSINQSEIKLFDNQFIPILNDSNLKFKNINNIYYWYNDENENTKF